MVLNLIAAFVFTYLVIITLNAFLVIFDREVLRRIKDYRFMDDDTPEDVKKLVKEVEDLFDTIDYRWSNMLNIYALPDNIKSVLMSTHDCIFPKGTWYAEVQYYLSLKELRHELLTNQLNGIGLSVLKYEQLMEANDERIADWERNWPTLLKLLKVFKLA